MFEERREKKERWPATVSVAILLTNGRLATDIGTPGEKLLIVRKRESGLLAPPAGGIIDEDESWKAALERELKEETGLDLSEVEMRSMAAPEVIFVRGSNKTSVGLVFEGTLKKSLPPEGYDPGNEEIDLVKFFTKEDLLDLLENKEKLFRPDFNYHVIQRWLWTFLFEKYGGFEGEDFALTLGRNWGLDESFIPSSWRSAAAD